ncbi:DMT family transporter [Ruania zhangjianzhongii]|uniref:DMT family transporter n=1 Tax=Ruania zhangjianzhongii TaxID=2603206 RepID=UPI0011C750ED|nr:multidrug efflux SMR transporter [Ruania zhangjianzhongii]
MRNTGSAGSAPPRIAATAWGLVLLAAGLEIIWALALAESDGLARPGWAITAFVLAIVSLVSLTLALRNLRLSSAYPVWVGLGAVGVALAGTLALGEPLTPARIACLALIVAGVIGLTCTDAPSGRSRTGRTAEAHHDSCRAGEH